MRSGSSEKKTTKLIKKGVLYSAPFLLFVGAMICISIWAFGRFVASNPLYRVLVDDDPPEPALPERTVAAEENTSGETYEDAPIFFTETEPDSDKFEPYDPSTIPAPRTAETFPVIGYGQRWGTIRFFGWKRRGIPLYCGDETSFLTKGACMSFRSSFCGQGGRTIISAHVNSYFYELEDVERGDIFYIDTVYGRYVYRVKDVFKFQYNDPDILFRAHKGEPNIAFLYTCYPRKHPYEFKKQRLGIIGEMIEGKDWSLND